MPTPSTVPIDLVRQALERAGYLLKSRIVRALSASDFFVEPNVTYSGRGEKSHRVDLTAETARGLSGDGVCVKTTFVVQAINNAHPIVLLTERPSTPNADAESYLKFGISPDPCPFIDEIHPYEDRSADWHNLFAEVCALTKVEGQADFSAVLPDEIYLSLLNASQHAEEEMASFNEWIAEQQGRYWRLFFWHPMLVVSGQLLTVKIAEDGAVQLQEVAIGRLEFNWHDGEARKTTVVEVIREDFLLERLDSIREQDAAIAERIRIVKAARQPGKD